jgi:hypothetical protein
LSPQADENNTPPRQIRADADVWEPFEETAAAMGGTRASVLRDVMNYLNQEPGAKMPRRPVDPPHRPADDLPSIIAISRDGATAKSLSGRALYEILADARDDDVIAVLREAGIKSGFSTMTVGARTLIRVLGAASLARRIHDALLAADIQLIPKELLS